MIFGSDIKTIVWVVGSISFVSPIFLYAFRFDYLFADFEDKLSSDYPEVYSDFKKKFVRFGRGRYFVSFRPFKLIKYLNELESKNTTGSELTNLIEKITENIKQSLVWLTLACLVFIIVVGVVTFLEY